MKTILLTFALLFPAAARAHEAHEHAAPAQAYACPMHPEVKSDQPGKCWKCGMTMKPVEPAEPSNDEHEHAGMDMSAPPAPSMQHGRDGSGTSWMPDDTPVFAHHFMPGGWMLMLHYSVIAGVDDQWSDRGSRRFTSTNWVMGMATHALLGGELTLRSMLSLEPATAGGATAVPLLLQSGETYGGLPLHDRQHPHDFFMEVAALYRHELFGGLGLELYGAPSGEPALGPTAFMHRLSASLNPFPPIGHHWQDSTHISFPVLTAGVYNRFLKLEGSVFHGGEPDEDRWNFDFGALDSWSVRLSANPWSSVSAQVSYGFIKSPEALRPEDSEHRLTASVQYTAGGLALTGVWGRNIGSQTTDSLLGEAQLDLDGQNVPFLRLEVVQKPADELVVPGDEVFGVGLAVLGFAHRFTSAGRVVPFVGAALDLGYAPGSLSSAYGTNSPLGGFVFFGIQPAKLQAGEHHHMAGM